MSCFAAIAGQAANAIGANNNIPTYLAKYPIRRPFLNAQWPPDYHQRKRPGTVANQPCSQVSHATCACERDKSFAAFPSTLKSGGLLRLGAFFTMLIPCGMKKVPQSAE